MRIVLNGTKKILALSSSKAGSEAYLETAIPLIKDFLGTEKLNIAFIPFASVENDFENYLLNVSSALASLQHTFNLVTYENALNIIKQSDVIMVGGGNTFKLLHDIYETKLLDAIRDKVNAGTPYIGWSAGSNITCPSIGTTNDMPIIEPQSFNALGLLPFQINPHYINQKPEGHNGETRDQRLKEFMKMNPGISVIGLPEGTALLLENKRLQFIGAVNSILFYDKESEITVRQILPGTDISYLL